MVRRGRLLELDPDLAEGLTPAREALAREHLVVRLARIESGHWTPSRNEFGAMDGIGLLIVEGLAIRRVALGHRAAAELLAAGDVLRPWEDDGEHAAYPFSSSFRVLDSLEFAVLDAAFMQRLLHFPEIMSHLMGRVMRRSRRVVDGVWLERDDPPSVETQVADVAPAELPALGSELRARGLAVDDDTLDASFLHVELGDRLRGSLTPAPGTDAAR